MSNPFNYRCPKCGTPDEIEISTFVSVRLTSNGAEIADQEYIDGSYWSSENAAGCGAGGYDGAVKDFEPSPAGVVSLYEYRRR